MTLLRTTKKDIEAYLEKADRRMEFDSPEEGKVKTIINVVKKSRDKAIVAYTEKFDRFKLKPPGFALTEKEWEQGIKGISEDLKTLIDMAAERLERFYSRTVQNSWFTYDEYGNLLGSRVVPFEKVLVYAPGGKATYPSSVLMGAIPARVAGVSEILLTTPARDGVISPAVLYAARRAGVTRVYRLGGAQAIAGFSFGTETLPRVDKIVGPGNIYVALAKKQLYGQVDIDMIAGPSEVLIIFDSTAEIEHVALDMLSQMEHDENAAAVAVTDDLAAAKKLGKALSKNIALSKRRSIIEQSLNNSAILKVASLSEAVDIANRFSPEHLEIVTARPQEILPGIRNAGAVFLGGNTPEAVGDYLAGPNHILPTGGTARFFSPLGVESFMKRMNLVSFTSAGLKALGRYVADFATEEGLHAHADSVKARLKK